MNISICWMSWADSWDCLFCPAGGAKAKKKVKFWRQNPTKKRFYDRKCLFLEVPVFLLWGTLRGDRREQFCLFPLVNVFKMSDNKTLGDFKNFLTEHFTTLAVEVFTEVENIVGACFEENKRLRNMLHMVLSPEIKLHKIGLFSLFTSLFSAYP